MKLLRKRILHTVLLALGASFLCFILIDIAPGDYVSDLQMNSQLSSEAIEALRSHYGMGRPLMERYILWIRSVLSGTWGISFQYGCPISGLLLARAANTLVLTITATAITWPLAIITGVLLAASGSRKMVRGTGNALILTMLSVPDLVVALLLLTFAVWSGWFPAGGMTSVNFFDLAAPGKLRDLANHLFLPVCCLSISTFPIVVMHVRSAMAEVLESTFVHAARAHGIGRRRLLFRHALLASSNSVISLFGVHIGGLISTSLVVEAVMGWPGLGRLMVDAIFARDVYVVVGATVASTFVSALGTLTADVMLAATDSRVQTTVL